MSSLRLFCASRLARGGSKGTFRNSSLCGCRGRARWQSTNMPPSGGSGASRIITYVTAGSIVVVGGGLAYANYDPVFKLKIDQYMPGFAKLADSAADSYVTLVDSVGLGKKKSQEEEMRPGLGQEGRRRSFRPHPAIGERKKEKGKEEVSTPRTAEEETTKPHEQPPPPVKKEAPLTPLSESSGGGTVTQEREEEEETDKSLTPSSQTSSSSPPPPVAEGREEGGKEGQVSTEEGRVEEKEAEDGEKGKEEGNSTESEVPSKSDEPSSVESSVAAAREVAARVAGEVMEESLREHQEAHMSEEHLGWLRDSAQVGSKLDESFLKFLSLMSRVLEAQRSVVEATREQSRLVREVSSSPLSTTTTGSDDTQSMGHTADALASAEENVAASRRALEEAARQHEEHFEELGGLMDRAVELGLKSKVEEIKRDVEEKVAQLVNGSSSIKEAEAEGKVLQLYHRQAEKKREELQRELGTELPEGDSRQEALLLMLGQRVDVLRKRLEEVEREHSKELSTALERQKERLDELAEQRLKWSLQRKGREAEHNLEYIMDKMEKEYQSDLREQLRIQTDTHTSHLVEALQSQADQLAVKWSEELELRLLEQGSYYQGQLVQSMARLRGIEYMINSIAHAGNETKRQQGLRAACDSLYTAVQSASVNPSPLQRYSFTQEVYNLREVAEDDPFIAAILDSLPTVATGGGGGGGGGMLCEGGLKERFVKVKRVCRRVALVPETGGGLGRYALSYLQSLLVVSWRVIERGAHGGEDTDPHKMDTFKVLECADDALSRGDLEQAVRYVNLLRGEPRRVAQDWLRDARHYLETAQAILLISQYLAALNISASPR